TRPRLHARFGIFVFKQRIQPGSDNRRARFEAEVSSVRRGAVIQTTWDEKQFVERRLPADCPRPRSSVFAARLRTVATQYAFHECLWEWRYAHDGRRLDEVEC